MWARGSLCAARAGAVGSRGLARGATELRRPVVGSRRCMAGLAEISDQWVQVDFINDVVEQPTPNPDPLPKSLDTGVWRAQLSMNMQELRFIYDSNTDSGQALSEFVGRYHNELKYLNPLLPMMVREGKKVAPKLVARYDFGVEKGVDLTGYDEAKIWKALYILNLQGDKRICEKSMESTIPENHWVTTTK